MLHDKGFSLVEVLVAVIVFSIGLLGLANLQIRGLSLQHDTLLRAIANREANDMADRMRANQADLQDPAASAYNNPTGLAVGDPSCLGLDANGAANQSSCTASKIAQHDFYEWYSALNGRVATTWHAAYNPVLPEASGIVCLDATPNDGTPDAPSCDNTITTSGTPVFAVKIWWRERKDNQATVRRHVMSFSL